MSVTDYAPSNLEALPIQDYLRGLGSDPDEVAETLRTMEVTGVKSFGTNCPVSRALSQAGYGDWSVSVYLSQEIVGWEPDKVEVEWGDNTNLYPITKAVYGRDVINPGPVNDFIIRFDKGLYPDLETEEVIVSTNPY